MRSSLQTASHWVKTVSPAEALRCRGEVRPEEPNATDLGHGPNEPTTTEENDENDIVPCRRLRRVPGSGCVWSTAGMNTARTRQNSGPRGKASSFRPLRPRQ